VQITVGGNEYLLDRLSVKKAWSVVRKIAPVVVSSGELLKRIVSEFQGQADRDVMTAIGPIADALAALPEEDNNLIIDTCLGVVRRQSNGNWVPVVQAGQIVFQDLTLAQVLKIVVEVLKRDVGSFLGELQSEFLPQQPGAVPNTLPYQTG
jgi:hypothetical protein